MNDRRTKVYGRIVLLLVCLATGGSLAQDTADDQVAVWAVIERLWAANTEGNRVEDLLTGDFVGWSYESPAPRTRASTGMWKDIARRQSKPLNYELYPLSIVVHGDTAIAHYLYTRAGEAAAGGVAAHNGRYTDVLVRDGGKWRFLGWHGGDFPPRD